MVQRTADEIRAAVSAAYGARRKRRVRKPGTYQPRIGEWYEFTPRLSPGEPVRQSARAPPVIHSPSARLRFCRRGRPLGAVHCCLCYHLPIVAAARAGCAGGAATAATPHQARDGGQCRRSGGNVGVPVLACGRAAKIVRDLARFPAQCA